MTDTPHARKKLVVFFAVVALSALLMVWLFWRFPLPTAIITLGVLIALGVCARLARSIEANDMSEMDRGSQLQ